jgi:hypothetical protein
VIEFEAGRKLKGKTLGDIVVFANDEHPDFTGFYEILVADREGVDVSFPPEQRLNIKWVIIQMRIGGRTFDFARIRPEMLDRLGAWKGGDRKTADEVPSRAVEAI